jgi:prephenate dehydrogenase
MHVGVYGLGRFGLFWAELLSDQLSVSGYNRSIKNIDSKINIVSKKELLNCEVIFLCVAISALKDVVIDLAPGIRPGTLLVDTCSVKVFPVEVMKKHLPDSVEILGSHPMFGPDSARNGVRGLPLIFTPERIDKSRYNFWVDFFKGYGMKIIEMKPHEHDREAAFTQGITHFIGRVLDDLHLEKSSIATMGYEKILDVVEQTCNDPYQLFIDLQQYNPYTSTMRNKLKHSVHRMVDQLHLDMSELHKYDIDGLEEN